MMDCGVSIWGIERGAGEHHALPFPFFLGGGKCVGWASVFEQDII